MSSEFAFLSGAMFIMRPWKFILAAHYETRCYSTFWLLIGRISTVREYARDFAHFKVNKIIWTKELDNSFFLHFQYFSHWFVVLCKLCGPSQL